MSMYDIVWGLAPCFDVRLAAELHSVNRRNYTACVHIGLVSRCRLYCCREFGLCCQDALVSSHGDISHTRHSRRDPQGAVVCPEMHSYINFIHVSTVANTHGGISDSSGCVLKAVTSETAWRTAATVTMQTRAQPPPPLLRKQRR
jgi:hypothetical protein